MTTSTAIVQMRAAPEYRGRVLALQAMVFLGSTPIGGPTVGWIIDAFGPRAGVAVGGLACLGGGRLGPAGHAPPGRARRSSTVRHRRAARPHPHRLDEFGWDP